MAKRSDSLFEDSLPQSDGLTARQCLGDTVNQVLGTPSGRCPKRA